MAYDGELEARIGPIAAGWGAVPRRMFGGVCWLLGGNIVCGVWKNRLILRLGEAAASEAFGGPWVEPFDVTGRPMKGWVMVEPAGHAGERLADWLEQARELAATLPPKAPGTRR